MLYPHSSTVSPRRHQWLRNDDSKPPLYAISPFPGIGPDKRSHCHTLLEISTADTGRAYERLSSTTSHNPDQLSGPRLGSTVDC